MVARAVYTIVSVIIVSLVSFIGIVSLLLKKKDLSKILLILVSLSAGTLLGGAFLHLLPEAVEEQGFGLPVSLSALAGVLVFFVLEKWIHMQRCEAPQAHTSHAYPLLHETHKHHLGILTLVGDGMHNFLDGLVIAGSYLVSVPVGIATTIAVVLHEIPQEIADFGVLLYGGFSIKKALLFNFFSAALAILGALIGLLAVSVIDGLMVWILPFTAGGFIYIAGADLLPELHKECRTKDSILHLFALMLGIGIMVGLKIAE